MPYPSVLGQSRAPIKASERAFTHELSPNRTSTHSTLGGASGAEDCVEQLLVVVCGLISVESYMF